jgi:hypothetical protein
VGGGEKVVTSKTIMRRDKYAAKRVARDSFDTTESLWHWGNTTTDTTRRARLARAAVELLEEEVATAAPSANGSSTKAELLTAAFERRFGCPNAAAARPVEALVDTATRWALPAELIVCAAPAILFASMVHTTLGLPATASQAAERVAGNFVSSRIHAALRPATATATDAVPPLMIESDLVVRGVTDILCNLALTGRMMVAVNEAAALPRAAADAVHAWRALCDSTESAALWVVEDDGLQPARAVVRAAADRIAAAGAQDGGSPMAVAVTALALGVINDENGDNGPPSLTYALRELRFVDALSHAAVLAAIATRTVSEKDAAANAAMATAVLTALRRGFAVWRVPRCANRARARAQLTLNLASLVSLGVGFDAGDADAAVLAAAAVRGGGLHLHVRRPTLDQLAAASIDGTAVIWIRFHGSDSHAGKVTDPPRSPDLLNK